MAPSLKFLTFLKVALAILLNTGVSVSQCPGQSIAFNHACYEFPTEELSFYDAQLYCEERNGTLAMPKTPAVDAYILGIIQYSGYEFGYWIGIENPNPMDPVPTWSDGTPVASGCQYDAFAEGQPSFPSFMSRMPPQCVMIWTDFLWSVSTCADPKRFICQYGAGDQDDCSGEGPVFTRDPARIRPDGRCGPDFPVEGGVPGECDATGRTPCCSADGQCGSSELHCDCPGCIDYSLLIVPDCPQGYHKLRDTCYGAKRAMFNYTQAESACAADGGTLAMPKHLQTDFFLIGLMIREAPEEDFWIGIEDRRWEYNHMFADGTMLADCAFIKWSTMSPRDRAHMMNCIMYWSSPGYFWHDMPCFETMSYMCQIGPGITQDCGAEEIVPTTTRRIPTSDPPSWTTRPPVVETAQGQGASTVPVWTWPRLGSTPPPPPPPPSNTFIPLTMPGQGGQAGAQGQDAGGTGAAVGGSVGAVATVGVGVGVGVLAYKKFMLAKVAPVVKA
ncbi:uncharacterized protein LOC144872343 [Branchiostoma floridae x Branchiostoma japonicum]